MPGMDRRGYNNSISRFLRMKGKSRLGVQNEITDYFLGLEFPKIAFLESKRMETDYGEWSEIYILTQTGKVESPEYFMYITSQINTIMEALKGFGVQDCGIQEFECDNSTYNILIYILIDGKEKESCRRTEYEEEFGDLYY